MRLVRRRICLQSPPDSTVGVGPKTILVQLEAPELHQNEILVQLDRPGVEKKLPSCTKIPVDPIAEILPGVIFVPWSQSQFQPLIPNSARAFWGTHRTCRRCVRPLLRARSRTPSRFLPFPHRDRECPPLSLSNPHPLLSRMPPFPFVRLRLSLPLPQAPPPPDATRCAFTCDGEARGHDDALPSSEGRRDGIPGRWRTFRTGPALDRVRRQKKKRPNERGTEETTEKAKGGIRFSKKGGKHLLFATQLSSSGFPICFCYPKP